ncbi:MAG TPA: isoamylase early set domain-containing protein [Gemmatimonadales bacterium]|nr:isoamylase early set domain-containing protein [Gemmatimonadales bacterium]
MNPLDPRLHQALDGDGPGGNLPPALERQRARLEQAAVLLATGRESPSVAARVMATVRHPLPARRARLLRWLFTPRAIVLRIRPAWSLALAAGILLVSLLPAPGPQLPLGAEEGIAQFVARFPGARSVSVVGSFNDWQPDQIPLEDRDKDGVWRGVVVLPAGTHEYMFVVDGERWVPDPLAGRYVEDDFGRQNSLLIVRAEKR